MAVHVEWVVSGKKVGETCRLLVFPFDMVWKEWESLFLKPFGGGFEALSGVSWVIWSVCGWLRDHLGEMAELVGNVQKNGLE